MDKPETSEGAAGSPSETATPDRVVYSVEDVEAEAGDADFGFAERLDGPLGEANAGQKQSRASKSSVALITAIIALAVVLVGGLVLGNLLQPPAGSDQVAQSDAQTTVAGNVSEEKPKSADEMTPADRVAHSFKTTDENGVVHGLTLDGIAFTIHGEGQAALQDGKVTLSAAGDHLIGNDALRYADANSGAEGDGTFDFAPWYQEVAPLLQSTDLRFTSADAVMVDNGARPYVGWPLYNTPPAAADALSTVQFNLVNAASNHSYDLGTYGIEKSLETWRQHPDIIVGGTFPTEQDRNTVQMIERDGMRIAFLGYTYGDNTYGDGFGEPNTYYACNFNPGLMEADIERAKKVADAVVVGMCWGTEHSSAPNDQQRLWAQWLADHEVDLVLGTHAQCIQPVEYYTGWKGKQVPVVFGLGNFITGSHTIDALTSGIFTCDFVRQEDGSVGVQNPVWHPVVEWSDGNGSPYVRFVKDLSREAANANTLASDASNPYERMRANTLNTITSIPVDLGEAQQAAPAQAAGSAAAAATADEEETADAESDAEVEEFVAEEEAIYAVDEAAVSEDATDTATADAADEATPDEDAADTAAADAVADDTASDEGAYIVEPVDEADVAEETPQE